MKHFSIRSQNRETQKKAERVLAETVIHRRQMKVTDGVWPFVVFGPGTDGGTVVRVGQAEQMRIHRAPVYIATLGGPHLPELEGIPVEEIADGDVPDEIKGMKIYDVSPMRPLTISSKYNGPPAKEAADELIDFYKGNDTAIIETPEEEYWVLSVLKYLDENDRFFPDKVLSNFYSRLGHAGSFGSSGSSFLH